MFLWNRCDGLSDVFDSKVKKVLTSRSLLFFIISTFNFPNTIVELIKYYTYCPIVCVAYKEKVELRNRWT